MRTLFLPLLLLGGAAAHAHEDIDISLQLDVPEPPIAAGLGNIDMVQDSGPFIGDDAPSGEAPFCLYVPKQGLELSVRGQNDQAGTFYISTGNPGDPVIAYSISLEDLITGQGTLGDFTPGAPVMINRPGLSDDGECLQGDNVSLKIAFPEDLASSFAEVVKRELSPGQTYEFRDVLTIRFSAPL